jgi:Rieske Fe-S protein
MAIDRREFVASVASFVAATAMVRTLRADATSAPVAASQASIIDAGPASAFTTDGVYDATRDQGCFVVRRDEQLVALSSVCTHRGCKVHSQPDGSYICKCHGSAFDSVGKVTKGPAKKGLPHLAVALDSRNHLEVDLTQKFAIGQFQPAPSP